jgi:uroporphyrinogen decarboxylase
MNSRQRFRTIMSLQVPDRVPLTEICFWPETIERWHNEGLPADQDPYQHFGLDTIPSVSFDGSLRLDTERLEETDEYVVDRNSDGVTMKSWKTHTATPLETDFLIRTREDWERYSDRLQPSADRIPEGTCEAISAAQDRGDFIVVSPIEPVWWMLRTMGHDHALIAMAEQPTLIEEMIAAHTDMVLGTMQELIKGGVIPDAIWFFSDLCYRNGMLFSPRTYRQLALKYHRMIADYCHANGMFLILHCCGDVREFIPLLIESEFDCIQPLEARCGPDVRELVPLYGDQIAFFGNMAVDVMARGPEAAEMEVRSKMAVAKPGGGYIFHSDHSMPPTVSFESYTRVIDVARELAPY